MTFPHTDPRALPADARIGRWTAPDGWQIRRLDWPQPSGRPNRGRLLFAGGRGDFIEKYIEALAHWHAGGWTVTAIDWRGQGASRGDIVGGHIDRMDVLVDDMAALLTDWCAEGQGPHVVVAHSMGGHVLLRTLAERAPELDAGVLVAPMVAVNASPLPDWLAASIASAMSMAGWSRVPAWPSPTMPPAAGSRRQTFLTGSAERHADEAWWWDRSPGYHLGAPSWGWLNAAYLSATRLTDARLARITVPLLFVGTRTDRLVSAAAIERAARAAPGAELLMFEDAGHEILREADAVRLAAFARIQDFLDARAPA